MICHFKNKFQLFYLENFIQNVKNENKKTIFCYKFSGLLTIGLFFSEENRKNSKEFFFLEIVFATFGLCFLKKYNLVAVLKIFFFTV
jgi:hypothetical protein